MKQIRILMVTAAILVLAVIYSDVFFKGVATCFSIVKPFLIGGAIAFVLNIPMTQIENRLLGSWQDSKADKFKRPISLVLTILLMVTLVGLVVELVVPNLADTFAMIMKDVPAFLDRASHTVAGLNLPGLTKQADVLETISKNWDSMVEKIAGFMQSGLTSILGSTVQIVSSIISTVVNFVIAFIFAIYVLAQKETLAAHFNKLMKAYIKPAERKQIYRVLNLLNKNFNSFITGQCMDALVLGGLFVITLTVLRMPYALMIGVLIAVTALIPVVGAFIGAVVGAFLILMVNPMQSLIFLIVFVVLQQLEGNLIYPKIVGNSVGLPAIWVLVAITVGGSLCGVAGMLVFIPIASTVYALLREDVNKRLSI